LWQILMNNVIRQFSCFIACMLLLIFSAVQLTELLHSHAEQNHCAQSAITKKAHSDTPIIKYIAKCKFCKDLSHKQIHHFYTIATFSVNIEACVAISRQHPAAQQLFETAIHCWTNKGPPYAASFIS